LKEVDAGEGVDELKHLVIRLYSSSDPHAGDENVPVPANPDLFGTSELVKSKPPAKNRDIPALCERRA
jgi:hypothetical protein